MKYDEKEQRKVWDEIAEGWSNWRSQPLKEVIEFVEENKENVGKVLDVGCGNGRNLIPFAKLGFECYGIDFSKKMIEVAKDKFKKLNLKGNFKVGNATRLQFPSETFDYLICIAMLHHLNKEDGEKAIKEMKRVLKNNGKGLIIVWNKYSFSHLDFVFKPKETLIPWKRKGKIYFRYYYLYDWWELKKILEKYFKIKKTSGFFDENILFVVEK
ncbi:MAG: class I SAM-dependent methyltransferase [Candidatus Aenigmatarchaeota archaeon]